MDKFIAIAKRSFQLGAILTGVLMVLFSSVDNQAAVNRDVERCGYLFNGCGCELIHEALDLSYREEEGSWEVLVKPARMQHTEIIQDNVLKMLDSEDLAFINDALADRVQLRDALHEALDEIAKTKSAEGFDVPGSLLIHTGSNVLRTVSGKRTRPVLFRYNSPLEVQLCATANEAIDKMNTELGLLQQLIKDGAGLQKTALKATDVCRRSRVGFLFTYALNDPDSIQQSQFIELQKTAKRLVDESILPEIDEAAEPVLHSAIKSYSESMGNRLAHFGVSA